MQYVLCMLCYALRNALHTLAFYRDRIDRHKWTEKCHCAREYPIFVSCCWMSKSSGKVELKVIVNLFTKLIQVGPKFCIAFCVCFDNILNLFCVYGCVTVWHVHRAHPHILNCNASHKRSSWCTMIELIRKSSLYYLELSLVEGFIFNEFIPYFFSWMISQAINITVNCVSHTEICRIHLHIYVLGDRTWNH